MTTYLESDNIELDGKPLYKGEIVKSRTTNIWDAPTYAPPRDECAREGALDFKSLPSLGFEMQATYRRHHV